MSYTAQHYGIGSLEEARAYLENDVLRTRLIEISEALLTAKHDDPSAILGYPDDLKLKSSMTLFALADPGCLIFAAVLEKFYNGERDASTLKLAGIKDPGL